MSLERLQLMRFTDKPAPTTASAAHTYRGGSVFKYLSLTHLNYSLILRCDFES
jgi:hypothetical protein